MYTEHVVTNILLTTMVIFMHKICCVFVKIIVNRVVKRSKYMHSFKATIHHYLTVNYNNKLSTHSYTCVYFCQTLTRLPLLRFHQLDINKCSGDLYMASSCLDKQTTSQQKITTQLASETRQ